MKNSTLKNNEKSNLILMICLLLFVGYPTISNSQTYRTINAYMDDFAKNELYVKKSLMDYSVSNLVTILSAVYLVLEYNCDSTIETE